jgi:hypothetical protein
MSDQWPLVISITSCKVSISVLHLSLKIPPLFIIEVFTHHLSVYLQYTQHCYRLLYTYSANLLCV